MRHLFVWVAWDNDDGEAQFYVASVIALVQLEATMRDSLVGSVGGVGGVKAPLTCVSAKRGCMLRR